MPAAFPSRVRLSKKTVDAAEPASAERFVWDCDLSGFGLRITPQGVKSFVFQYRMKGEPNARRYTIGRYGAWTPDQARERCKELARGVEAGEHPRDAAIQRAEDRKKAKADAADLEFGAVSDRWLIAYENEPMKKTGAKRRPASISLAKFAVKKLKEEFEGKRIDKIDSDDLDRYFANLDASQAATRRNVFAYARILWAWAARAKLVQDNPFKLIDAPPPPQSRERALSDLELKTFWRATRKLQYPFAPFFRILALTGQRRSEVAGMAWDELDQTAREWNIPSVRTKNRKPHKVPLSDAVIAELDAMAPKERWPKKGLVFTVTNTSPISGISRAKLRLDAAMAELSKKEGNGAIPPWRLHDLRRTFVTGLQGLKVRFEVIEAAVNHISGRAQAGVAGVYNRYEWQAEKREAFVDWAAHIAGLLKPELVADEAAKGGSPP